VSVELLDQSTVVEYLISKSVISPDENAEVEVLTGGVSNVVLAITTPTQKLVLKQLDLLHRICCLYKNHLQLEIIWI
jgi:hypothetical protein